MSDILEHIVATLSKDHFTPHDYVTKQDPPRTQLRSSPWERSVDMVERVETSA